MNYLCWNYVPEIYFNYSFVLELPDGVENKIAYMASFGSKCSACVPSPVAQRHKLIPCGILTSTACHIIYYKNNFQNLSIIRVLCVSSHRILCKTCLRLVHITPSKPISFRKPVTSFKKSLHFLKIVFFVCEWKNPCLRQQESEKLVLY